MGNGKKLITISLLLLFVLVSCNSGTEQTSTPALIVSTKTASPTIETRNTSTIEMLPTQTVSPATPVVENTSTRTPAPTAKIKNQVTPPVPYKNKWAYIQDLIEENGYCKLPCLWGITPGVTTWRSIEPFLYSIADELEYGGDTTLSVNNSLYTLYPHYYRYYQEKYTKVLAIMFATNPAGVVEVITTGAPLTSKKFQINQVLTDYGEPAEILLESTDEFPPGYRQWYWIVLLYPENGIAAFYQGEGESVDEGIKSCPGSTGPELSLFSYKDMTVDTLVPLVKRIIFSDVGIPESISEIPGLTITEVYNELIDPSGCIIIPLPDYLR